MDSKKPLFQALSEDADVIAKALRKSDSGLVEVSFCLLQYLLSLVNTLIKSESLSRT